MHLCVLAFNSLYLKYVLETVTGKAPEIYFCLEPRNLLKRACFWVCKCSFSFFVYFFLCFCLSGQ